MTFSTDISLDKWMTNLPDSLKDFPLIYLAIPGSHDSMTYGITRKSDLAPDSSPALRSLWPLIRIPAMRWTITQSANVTQQLKAGIRYYDLRFATKSGTNDLYFTHALYADEVSSQFDIIKEYLDSHPDEVVILDCQHFYGFKVEDHRRLFNILINTFGFRICPPQRNLEEITLRSMNSQQQQVIVIYRNEVGASSGRFWRSGQFPTPWPQKTSGKRLLEFLQSLQRPPSAGFVMQAVITPTLEFIILRCASNIKESCAKKVNKYVIPWISTLQPGPPPPDPTNEEYVKVNVVISDFIDLNDNAFSKTIINLNYKLL